MIVMIEIYLTKICICKQRGVQVQKEVKWVIMDTHTQIKDYNKNIKDINISKNRNHFNKNSNNIHIDIK